jgi:hypothetical protein
VKLWPGHVVRTVILLIAACLRYRTEVTVFTTGTGSEPGDPVVIFRVGLPPRTLIGACAFASVATQTTTASKAPNEIAFRTDRRRPESSPFLAIVEFGVISVSNSESNGMRIRSGPLGCERNSGIPQSACSA